MSKKVNKGNSVSGGQQIVYNQAVGDGAQAHWHAPARVPGLLAHVEALLTGHESELPDLTAARAELNDLKQELAGASRPSVVKRALDGLNTFAKPVTPLVSAVAQLTQAIHGGG
jgi:hypothetical protein